MRLLATTNGSLESVAGAELSELVGADPGVHHRGVIEFDGSHEDVYDLHYRSRTCHRVMEVLADERVSELSDVYDATRAVDVAAHLPDESFGVVGTRHGHHDFSSVDVADRVGQAVIDGYREATGTRLPVDLDDPTVRLEAYVHDDRFTLAVDLTGDSLHKRPYRVCEHDAPLRATLDADVVVTNLPFGIRLEEDLRDLYGAVADRVREGSVRRLVALTTRPDLLPLEPLERHDVPYGRIDATIVVWDR